MIDLAAARAPALIPDHDPVLHPIRHGLTTSTSRESEGEGTEPSKLTALIEEDGSEELDEQIDAIDELMGATDINQPTEDGEEAAPLNPRVSKLNSTTQSTAVLEPPILSTHDQIQIHRAMSFRALLILLRTKFTTPKAVALTPSAAYVLLHSSRQNTFAGPLTGPAPLARGGAGGNALGTPGDPRAAAALAGTNVLQVRAYTASHRPQTLGSVIRVWDFALSAMLSLNSEVTARSLAARGEMVHVLAPLGRVPGK